MSTESNCIVRVARRFNASAEHVFDAWLDPAIAGKWLFATPAGRMVRVAIDARVGGAFTFVDRREGEDVEHTGEYIEIERPHRLVFDFSVPKYAKEVTRVSIDIVALQSGCDLTLTHENVFPEYAGRTENGWRTILDGLAATLS